MHKQFLQTIKFSTFFFLMIMNFSGFSFQPGKPTQQVSSTHSSSLKASPDILKVWMRAFQKQARQKGYSDSLLHTAFKGVSFNVAILKAQERQPEYTTPVMAYLKKRANRKKIHLAQEKLAYNQAILIELEKRFHVDKETITAIWGIESAYGEYKGKYDVFEALSMLAAYTHRRKFAENQIYALLDILRQNLAERYWLKGSWAGAMGHMQFIPSSYLSYAKDQNQDGRINIWTFRPDAFASAANYLHKHGWQYQEPCYLSVILPKGYVLSTHSVQKAGYLWAKDGFVPTGKGTWTESDLRRPAKLYLPAGLKGPALLISKNFEVIKAYNTSNSYALSVCEITHRLKKKTPIYINPDRTYFAFSRQQIKVLQQQLQKQGFQAGKPDGVLGHRTKKALRDFQIKYNLPADGYLNKSLYDKVIQKGRTVP